jgi:predicted transcriptional regulator
MAKPANNTDLTSIKRLLVFALLNSGASQSQVAAALGVDPSVVSRMFSAPKKAKSARGKSK